MSNPTGPPKPKERGLETTLRTLPATETAVRDLTRRLAVELGRTPTHDEVILAAVTVASWHMNLLTDQIGRAR